MLLVNQTYIYYIVYYNSKCIVVKFLTFTILIVLLSLTVQNDIIQSEKNNEV